MPGRWSKPEWDNLALVMPSPTAKKGSFKVYPKLAGQEACLLTYWVENKQMEPQESATHGKSRAKQDEKHQQQKKSIEMLEVMKMLQTIHLDKINIHGRNTFMVKYFQTLASP